MKSKTIVSKLALSLCVVCAGVYAKSATALDLDWSGQFRSEAHTIFNYSMDSANATPDAARVVAEGYYIPGGGKTRATFQTLFLKLKPKVIVNDNVYIKSEWWLSDPIYGFFGSGAPYSVDQRQYYSTQSRGSLMSVQRLWLDVLTDIGTFQVGRAPLHWGLGLVWNSGDGLWDRYESTGDVLRLVSKFGSFSFTPAIVKYSAGNNLGGASNVTLAPFTNTVTVGEGNVMDYSLMLKYENPDEDFEGGVHFVKRIAGAAQDPVSGWLGVGTKPQTPVGMNFNTWDLYGQKKFSKVRLSGEVPITSGDIGGIEYKSFALALDGNWKLNDTWEFSIRTGLIPGQPNQTGGVADKIKGFYFHPNYHLALIMFNYQLAGFAGPNTQNNPNTGAQSLLSPYDNPMTNANYLTLGAGVHVSRWTFRTNFAFASARESAIAGADFFNTWKRKYVTNLTGTTQAKSLGWEMDYGAAFQWDDSFLCQLDMGFFFPGGFYKFSNTATENTTSTVIAGVARVGVTF